MLTISTLRSVSYYTDEIAEVFGYYNDDKAKAESRRKQTKGESNGTEQDNTNSQIKVARWAPPRPGNGLLDVSDCTLADDARGHLALLLHGDARLDVRSGQGGASGPALRGQQADSGNYGNGAIVTRSDELLEEQRQRDRLDPPGEWSGAFAKEIFGDQKHVRQEDFAALFFGFHPKTGEPLTKTADRDGFELFKIEVKIKKGDLPPNEIKRLKKSVTEIKGRLKEKEAKQQQKNANKIGELQEKFKDLKGEERLAIKSEIEALQKQKSNHRPGVDLTWTPPKDFSLLVAAVSPEERRELLDICKRVVSETFNGVESKYARTRRRDETGALQSEKIKGGAIAFFEHLSARPVDDKTPPDPDVHFHGTFFSPVHCFDNQTRALWTNEIRLNMKVIDAEIRARLAVEVARRGYSVIEDKQKNVTSFHLNGIKPEDRAHYSKRREKIKKSMECGEFGKSSVAALATREGKGDWTRSDCLNAWKAEFAQRGISAEAIKNSQPDAPRKERTDAEIIDGLLDMKAYFSSREVRQAVWEEMQFASIPEGADIGEIAEERINRILKSPDLLQATLPDGSSESRQRTASDDREPIFTTRTLIKREIQLDRDVEEIGKRTGHRIEWQDAIKIIEEIEAEKTAEARAKDPNAAPFRFRDDQRSATAKILAGGDFSLLQAFAGTGKTTAAAAIFAVYKRHGMKVVALAPSNKAAKQLSDDCKLEGDEAAKTIDAFLLGKDVTKCDSNTILFVDESSMVSFDLAEKLCRLAKERGCKLVLQGDKNQLPSVQRGRVFARMAEQGIGTEAAELVVINRQREEYARQATEAAAKGDFAQTLDLLDAHGKIHTEGTDEAVLERLAQDHLNDPQPPSQKLIVASRNADVEMLNQKIRAALVKQGKIEAGIDTLLIDKDGKTKTISLGCGDRIIFTDTLKNGRSVAAANGSLGTVQHVEEARGGLRVVVLLDGASKPIEFNTKDFGGLAWGHAISIHKSQGQTSSSARFLFSEFISSELAYVALSRHRDNVGLYCRQDQREYLGQFMGRKMEKLDARELVTSSELAAIENEAQTARKRDADWHAKTIEHIKKRLPALLKIDPRKLRESGDRLLEKGKSLSSKIAAFARGMEERALNRKEEERQQQEARQKQKAEIDRKAALREALKNKNQTQEPERRRGLRF